jgi:hypothetical protein
VGLERAYPGGYRAKLDEESFEPKLGQRGGAMENVHVMSVDCFGLVPELPLLHSLVRQDVGILQVHGFFDSYCFSDGTSMRMIL